MHSTRIFWMERSFQINKGFCHEKVTRRTPEALKLLIWYLCIVTGIYCGPLRLLAWEVSKRLNKANIPCNLITGQEREEIDGAKHTSVTVEMADVTCEYQCAIVDEIQACQWIIKKTIIYLTEPHESCCFSYLALFLSAKGTYMSSSLAIYTCVIHSKSFSFFSLCVWVLGKRMHGWMTWVIA